MKIKFERSFGDVVRDKFSGFEGVVVSLSRWAYGCTRATVQPRCKEGENQVPASCAFDEQQLELIEGSNKGTTVNFKFDFEDVIADSYVSYKGIVVGVTKGEYGKMYITVGKTTDSTKMPDTEYIKASRAVLMEKAPKKPEKVVEDAPAPGGPSQIEVRKRPQI